MKYIALALSTLLSVAYSNEVPSPKLIRSLFASSFYTAIEHDKKLMEKSTTQIDLGRTLFFDKRLSANSNISCNDCHDLK